MSRGLGDVYKRQDRDQSNNAAHRAQCFRPERGAEGCASDDHLQRGDTLLGGRYLPADPVGRRAVDSALLTLNDELTRNQQTAENNLDKDLIIKSLFGKSARLAGR